MCGHSEGFAQREQSGEEETLTVGRPEEGELIFSSTEGKTDIIHQYS